MIPLIRNPVVAVDDLPFVVLAEFADQPGLRLTFRQVQRMWGLSERECFEVLDYLTDIGLLECEDGQFKRADVH